MTSPKTMQCVTREVAPGDFQFVPVNEVPFLNADDVIVSGSFRTQVERFGPSGSHERTICLPVGELTRTKVGVCVLRELGGSQEYVPVGEVPFLNEGEPVFTGLFRGQLENHGPSGSHKRTVCVPVGVVTERRHVPESES